MIFYYKTLLIITMPLVFCFTFLIFWVIHKLIYKKTWKYMMEKFSITVALIMTFFMFSIVNTCAQFLDCTNIDGEYFVTNYLLLSCSSEDYLWWKYLIILPTIFIFSLMIPAVILLYMFKHRHNLFQKNILYKVGYMLNGYKTEIYYW